MHVLKPLEAPYDTATETLLNSYPKRDGYLLGLFRVIANSPRHLAKIAAAGLLDRGSPLPMREREIVILRTTALKGCEYEWGVHVTAFADHVGLSPEQVDDTLSPEPDLALWSEAERWLMAIVDALSADGGLSAELVEAFRETWNEAEQLEILCLVGFYHTISFIARSADLELEPWAARFASRQTDAV
jgi:alkylhydroperoxidase family enzyme